MCVCPCERLKLAYTTIEQWGRRSFRARTVPRRSTLNMQVRLATWGVLGGLDSDLRCSDPYLPLLCSLVHWTLFVPGDIKAFFSGVKAEKNEVKLHESVSSSRDISSSSPSTSASREPKPERDTVKLECDRVKHEQPSPKATGAFFSSPVRQRQQLPTSQDADAAKASRSATGFVPASSLLGKRAPVSPVRAKSPATVSSCPPRPSPSKKAKAKGTTKDSKQGSMLAFLQPKRS